MNKKVKIYANFLLCFVVCMALYLFSTYFRDLMQYLFQAEARYWNIEFVLIVAVSIFNGSILEYYNKILLEQPAKIFVMLKYLILQLYLFSIILFYIMMVSNSTFGEKTRLGKVIMPVSFAVLLMYIFFLLHEKKRNQKKLSRVDLFKIIIGTNLIFQSTIFEIIFLGLYFLLMYWVQKINILKHLKLKKIVKLLFGIILLTETYLLLSEIDIYSKFFLSVTNIFVLFVGKKDFDHCNSEWNNSASYKRGSV